MFEDTEEYRHARRLCIHLAEKHFPPNPDWKPCPDLMGVLLQIDNMTTALVHKDTVKAGES